MKNFFLSICLLIIFSIFVNTKPLSGFKTNKTRIYHPNDNKVNIKIKDLKKDYYNNLVNKGLRLDNLTEGNPSYPFYRKINYKEDKIKRKEIIENFKKTKNRRRLYETQSLENLGFVDLYQKNDFGNTLFALKFLMNSIKKEDTKFVLYPYPFKYQDKNEEEKTVEEGGFFSLNESLLDGGKFNYLKNISSVQIGKAKGIYDIDIAIMSLIYEYNGREIDLFTETSLYCEFFVNQINKVTTCLDGKNDYLEYKSHYPNKGAVVRISEKDLLNNTLFDSETGQLNFKLLIFTDYMTITEEVILDLFINQEAREVIKRFRDLGGSIIASGKSGRLLQLMNVDLIPSETFSSKVIYTKAEDSTNKIYGCEKIYKDNPGEQSDFLKELICVGNKDRTFLSQAYEVKNVPDNFESLIQFTNEENNLYYKDHGYIYDINDVNATFDYILVSKEEYGKGRIMLVNGNPIKDMIYLSHVRNMILFTMTKNVIYDLKIKFTPANADMDDELPIPAGEEGIQLVASYKLYNLGDYDLTDVEINILIAKKVEIISTINGCEIKNDNKYKDLLNISYIDDTKYLKCSLAKLNKLSMNSNSFLIEITDFSITQKLYDIPLMYSNIEYKDNEMQKVNICPGLYNVQATIAAVLRGTINKDPTSIYPLEGYGRYFDLVLNVENKESTEAKDVNYISLIPLVTPLFDGEDEGSVSKIIPLYEEYYDNHEYIYPWTEVYEKSQDYIDYAEIAGKGVCYVADYDTPVKLAKKERNELKDIIPNLFEPEGIIETDENAGKDKATNANSLLHQIYFADNEKFYETATARTSLFINTAKEEGAKAMYGDEIPEGLEDPYHPNRTKVQYAFIRVDTYFYNSIHEQYQLPDGFDNSILISIDKFNQSKLGEPTGEVLGDIKPKIVNKGHYDSAEKIKFNRLKPNEYSNSLREYKFMKQYDPTNEIDLKELQKITNTTVYLSHFMIPFIDKNDITRAGSILGFKEFEENGDGSGYLEEYPSIKFVYGHSIDLILDPANTRLGGAAEIILGNGVKFNDEDPIKEERITISADNVAFYKTEYNKEKNIVTVHFKRGLMPNENYGKPSKCKVFLENLNKKEDFDITLKIYNLKYDFSKANLESLILVEGSTKTITATYKAFFSLPCLYMENKLNRNNSFTEEENHNMFEYEIMNPYARYGGYYQELTRHTAVYASAEAHHVKRPGFQSSSSGFSLLANIGTSSVPFAEFLTHGKLAVPGVTSTSRLEWTDIWGRKWSQNLRSVYPDIPVLPPVPLSFIMTTTYELLTDDEYQERVLEWQSDESVYIRVQMKVRNTYKLYWEPTICLENQKPFIKEKLDDYRNPVFLDFSEDLNDIQEKHDVNLGFGSTYGVCYNQNSYIGGQKITADKLDKMHLMMSCSDSEDAAKMSECSKQADTWGLPLVKKRPEDVTDEEDTTPEKRWNYSPLIESYYPDDYIHSNKMWQLTMEEDYWDDSFYKGYPWHLDDCIPNLDNPILKPHDLIAFPIYKGLGYNITYSQDYSLNKFSEYKGWWSDQLQNKDHTLLAGQQKVNQISVGKESLLKDSDWINAREITNTKKPDLLKNRLKNIYVCQYNQNRVKVKPGQSKYAFLKNVYQNNVVPVLPDLSENDPKYTNFDCTEDTYQYSPYNISKVDNRVYTGNDRDWLYFAVGLRSNARENINVILKMEPIEGSKYEGITKVQDGGRFTYWQPPDGPNSYQYYDCNVNTVMSKRVDLSITQKMIPINLPTFNIWSYQLFTIADKKEKNREYTMNTYMNSHGYGDATTTIYVGGIDATSCKVNPGEFTYVKIVFYNNAGFDWKMKQNAITINSEGYSIPLNAMSIMMDKVTAIQYPKEYNFMSYEIPDEIRPYVTLTPSQHNLDISPQFYDLTFNNVLNIKDALEGDYFYCLNVSKTFPEKYKGKLWEIKMKLNEEYFETLPSPDDPTGIHDYHLTIPSIKFGVPLSSGPYAGKVFYTLGQASNLVFSYKIYKEFEVYGIKIANDEDINKLSVALSNTDEKMKNLKKAYDNISGQLSEKITFTEENLSDGFYKLVTVDLSKLFPLFPYEVEMSPYITNISFLVCSSADHVPNGYRNLFGESLVSYDDGRKTKNNLVDFPLYINCYGSGPHLGASAEHEYLDYEHSTEDFDYVLKPQYIYEGDLAFLKLTLSAANEGTDIAYNALFSLGLIADSKYVERKKNTSETIIFYDLGVQQDVHKITIYYNGRIYPGDEIRFDIYFEVPIGNGATKNQKKGNIDGHRILEKKPEKEFVFLKNLDISLCLVDIQCQEGDDNYGIQRTGLIHKLKYKDEPRAIGRISLKSENNGTEIMPIYILTAKIIDVDSSYNVSQVEYLFKRKIEGRDSRFILINSTTDNQIIDVPFEEGEIDEKKQYKVTYKVIGEFPDGRTLDSMTQNQITFTYYIEDDKKEREGVPLYLIIIIIAAGMACIVFCGFLIYKLGCKKKHYLIDESNGSTIRNKSKFEELSSKEKSSTRNMGDKIHVIKYMENK